MFPRWPGDTRPGPAQGQTARLPLAETPCPSCTSILERNLRLLSSRNNSYNRDYHAESPDGEQSPVLNVFTRDGGGIRHRWATELMSAPRDEGEEPRHLDSIWPIWNVLDMTPGGRGSDPDFPAMQYE
jgi:predicted dithiol-disulfide oxidoreductase (DUF899 family)